MCTKVCKINIDTDPKRISLIMFSSSKGIFFNEKKLFDDSVNEIRKTVDELKELKLLT